MRVIKKGHTYELTNKQRGKQELKFFCDQPELGEQDGVLNQEVLRALIDRTKHLDERVPWAGNAEIIECYRRALILHEARALIRKAEHKKIDPEQVMVGADGHFLLSVRVGEGTDAIQESDRENGSTAEKQKAKS